MKVIKERNMFNIINNQKKKKNKKECELCEVFYIDLLQHIKK